MHFSIRMSEIFRIGTRSTCLAIREQGCVLCQLSEFVTLDVALKETLNENAKAINLLTWTPPPGEKVDKPLQTDQRRERLPPICYSPVFFTIYIFMSDKLPLIALSMNVCLYFFAVLKKDPRRELSQLASFAALIASSCVLMTLEVSLIAICNLIFGIFFL